MRPTTGPTRKDGVKQKHSVFRNSSQPPKVEFFVGKLEAPIPSMNLFDLVIYINLFSGDVYKPRRPGDAGHRALGAGRGDTAGLGQVQNHLHLFHQVHNYCHHNHMTSHHIGHITFILGLLLSHLFTYSFSREIVSHKRIVQNNKQLLSSLRRKARDRDLAPYRFLHFDSIYLQ